MKKFVAPEVFEYFDCETDFETTDKELAILVLGYAKKKSEETIDKIKEEVKEDLDETITRLKKEIREENDSN